MTMGLPRIITTVFNCPLLAEYWILEMGSVGMFCDQSSWFKIPNGLVRPQPFKLPLPYSVLRWNGVSRNIFWSVITESIPQMSNIDNNGLSFYYTALGGTEIWILA